MSTGATDNELRAVLARAENIQGSARLANVSRAARTQRRTRRNAGLRAAGAVISAAIGSIVTVLLTG